MILTNKHFIQVYPNLDGLTFITTTHFLLTHFTSLFHFFLKHISPPPASHFLQQHIFTFTTTSIRHKFIIYILKKKTKTVKHINNIWYGWMAVQSMSILGNTESVWQDVKCWCSLCVLKRTLAGHRFTNKPTPHQAGASKQHSTHLSHTVIFKFMNKMIN